MKILIIKTSSLGDIIHTLPALTDAKKALPHAQFDWIVEENFIDIPSAHPAIDHVIPIAIRRWRKQPLSSLFSREVRKSIKQIRQQKYDIIIDAQCLLKSIIITWISKGFKKHGLSKDCSRGKIDCFYSHKHHIDPQQHAIDRIRQLFAQSLGYAFPKTAVDYGLVPYRQKVRTEIRAYIVFIHGTAWPSKQWPTHYWHTLAIMLKKSLYPIYLPAGNEAEYKRAKDIAKDLKHVHVLPSCSLQELLIILKQAKACVAVDTGLAHLTAAVNTPCVTLYGASNPSLTSVTGKNQVSLSANFHCSPCLQKYCQYHAEPFPPCYQTLPPQKIYETLAQFI